MAVAIDLDPDGLVRVAVSLERQVRAVRAHLEEQAQLPHLRRTDARLEEAVRAAVPPLVDRRVCGRPLDDRRHAPRLLDGVEVRDPCAAAGSGGDGQVADQDVIALERDVEPIRDPLLEQADQHEIAKQLELLVLPGDVLGGSGRRQRIDVEGCPGSMAVGLEHPGPALAVGRRGAGFGHAPCAPRGRSVLGVLAGGAVRPSGLEGPDERAIFRRPRRGGRRAGGDEPGRGHQSAAHQALLRRDDVADRHERGRLPRRLRPPQGARVAHVDLERLLAEQRLQRLQSRAHTDRGPGGAGGPR
ncbi:hypothetical protein ACFJIX_00615 [Roseateles sp. UC29_93]|uniref:hypothetical protein n=1 Tax=Roseateles sp. UC29_93 TaxID=3350177 RepID=UPI003671C969